MRDAFLAERDAHCVRDAGFACDARLRRVQERIVSPITAQRHHLSLICKSDYLYQHCKGEPKMDIAIEALLSYLSDRYSGRANERP